MRTIIIGGILGLVLVGPILGAEQVQAGDVQVTSAERLAVSQAHAKYWQAMYALERATGELQGALAQVESRCVKAGGLWQAQGGVDAIQCVKPPDTEPLEQGSDNGPERTDPADGN